MDPNGKLFKTKLEEPNRFLGDRKIIIAERAGKLPRYDDARETRF